MRKKKEWRSLNPCEEDPWSVFVWKVKNQRLNVYFMLARRNIYIHIYKTDEMISESCRIKGLFIIKDSEVEVL